MKLLSLAFAFLSLSACVSNTPDYLEVMNLSVRFIEPTSWNGKVIPASQICTAEGGRGSTPALFIEDVPPGTNVLIMEINNLSNPALSTGGGQGSIGFYHDGSASATLLPVPGEEALLPTFAFQEKASRINPARPYPYMPPCVVRKNKYAVTVKAIKRTGSFDKQKSVLLGEGFINLGEY